MDGRYAELIEKTSREFAEGLLGDVEYLIQVGDELDGFVLDALRAVGRLAMRRLYEVLSGILVERLSGPTLPVERRPTVPFRTVFGEVEVESPYLRNRTTGESRRPMLEVFGVEGQRYSRRLERAMVDFGSEKSFERAAKGIKEHYGLDIGRTTILRRTHAVANDAVEFLEDRLSEAQQSYEQPLSERPGVAEMVSELDGCEIRTGRLQKDTSPDGKRHRDVEWREVRTGLVRVVGEVDPLYVCKMASYPDICEDLFAVGCLRALSEQTQVIGVGDGANGLREEMAAHFPNFRYILDRPHLKTHFFETAEALGIEEALRPRWVGAFMDRLHQGDSDDVLEDLRNLLKETRCDRLRRFIEYLERFADAVHYDLYEERGWPLGSGEIESAHRFIPQERLKIAGACWHPDSVNPMLALRVMRANGWWGRFWEWKKARKRAA
jgi:hypothetical protein